MNGFIPACGEQTLISSSKSSISKLYPRIRGDNTLLSMKSVIYPASSPRTGRRFKSRVLRCSLHGIIPAYGETISMILSLSSAFWLHPRVWGNNSNGSLCSTADCGFIPVYGETIPFATEEHIAVRLHPRLRGTDPGLFIKIIDIKASSPHTGRQSASRTSGISTFGFIPAYGETITGGFFKTGCPRSASSPHTGRQY